jgi:hypothetical protein
MAIFRRTPKPSPIPAFWEWWQAGGREQVTASIAASDYGDLPATLSRLTDAIDPGLSWHFSAGRTAQHALTVTAGGVAEHRPAAERWLRAAPPADAIWEFRSSQQADPSVLTAGLQFAGEKLAVGETVFAIEVDEQQRRVDVGAFNPAFPGLPEPARGEATFLMLDWILGEDAVTRWVGVIEFLAEPPAEPSTIADLQAVVEGFRESRNPDLWSSASGEIAGEPVVILARTGMRWLDAPTLDLHHEIVARYGPHETGFPSSDDLSRLQQEEEPLESLLGDRGVLMAYVTGSGRRVIHFYTDGEDQNAAQTVAEFATKTNRKVTSQRDPAWRSLRAIGL